MKSCLDYITKREILTHTILSIAGESSFYLKLIADFKVGTCYNEFLRRQYNIYFFQHLMRFLAIISRVLKSDLLNLLWYSSSSDSLLKQPLSENTYK